MRSPGGILRDVVAGCRLYGRGMELVDDKLQLALTYVEALEQAGVPLSIDDLDGFAVQPTPLPARRRSSYMAAMQEELLHDYFIEPGEKPSAFLLRSQWITVVTGSVRLTPIGEAVLGYARRPELEKTPAGPLAVTIDPDDPLAYIRIFALLGSAGTGMLVDPYLRFEELHDLAGLSRVNRVLTSDHPDKSRLRLKHLARTLGEAEMKIEVRTLPHAKLHDRFYIPDAGHVFFLGSSLNSITARPGVIAPIEDETAASALRNAYAKLWRSATVLPPSARTERTESLPA